MSNENAQQAAVISDYQRTFNSDHGAKVLRHLMRVCGMMAPSMDMRDPAPISRRSMRAVELWLLRLWKN